jgi:two-component system cell cycle sensor histidine kinase/response regulator CckA
MKLRILHVEDSPDDSEIIRQLLIEEGIECEIERRETRDEFVERLRKKDFDLIFADCSLPSFTGLHALELAREHAPDVPFIFVSGSMGEEMAIESLRNGATDYVLKGRLSRLVPAVRRAIEEARERSKGLEMEMRLRQAQNLETVGTLAGGIAHDFNNILTIIKGHASLLDLEANHPDRVGEIAAIIDHAARRGSDLVKQILAFARKSDGTFTMTDFNRLVRDLISMLREAMSRNVTFQLELDENLPHIMADAAQIERVVINLVTNASDAMPRGGPIVVATQWLPGRGDIPCLSELPDQEYLLLRVTDSGMGMNEETRRHIFEPFFTTKPKGKGTGLGMPVVYGLMQMHRGAIDVASEPGKGTAISLYFPVVTEESKPDVNKTSSKPQEMRGTETLLVVDDEPDVISFLRLMLEAHGYRVLTAAHSEEALTLFHEHRDEIKLLFSDLGLPTLNGFDLSELLQRLKPGLKTLLASGYADSQFKSRLEEPMAVGFISKPYSPDTVLRAIRATLDESQFPLESV